MRQVVLTAVLAAATAILIAQEKEPPAPAGCSYRAYRAYSECQTDGWHVVTDGLYTCTNGEAGSKRVHDIKTDHACTGDKKTKEPEPQEAFTSGLQGCQSPLHDGDIFVQRCIDKIWYNVKYLRYRCLDGSIRLDAPTYFSTGKPCGGDQTAPQLDPANPGTQTALNISMTTLDASQPETWTNAPPLPRDSGTQRMMIDLLDLNVPGTRVASADPLRHLPAAIASAWHALSVAASPTYARAAAADVERGIWLAPLGGSGGGGLQGVTRAARVHAYLTSLGTSTGEAFDIQVVNDGPTPVRLAGDGVVVEPIKKGTEKTLRAELQKAVATRGQSVVTSRANAYCLEFKLNPPDQGSMFRVVDGETQKQYGAAREILRASRRLQAANQLQPDSDPKDYFHAIRQWAIWVSEQHFTQAQYRQAFIARTQKNIAAVGAKWTSQMQDALNSLVPHRWDEIVKILRAAGQPVPGA